MNVTEIDTWKLLTTNQIIKEILTCTNIYQQSMCGHFLRIRDVLDTDADEVRAVLGLLYMARILNSNYIKLSYGEMTDPLKNFLGG